MNDARYCFCLLALENVNYGGLDMTSFHFKEKEN